jgi:hypothetical protein
MTIEESSMTLDQMFENFRKASTSSWQFQQDMLKQYAQQWPWSANTVAEPTEWAQQVQKRWTEFASETLDRSKESLEVLYKLTVELIEMASRVRDAKSPDEYRRGVEEVRAKMFDVFKEQSDAQLRDFQKTAEKWFETLAKA